nr:MAG TPA: hypothetical protein [Caudoviricetes sp.]
MLSGSVVDCSLLPPPNLSIKLLTTLIASSLLFLFAGFRL